MTPIKHILITIVACVSSSFTFGSTELYEWVDEENVTHYSEQPPLEDLTLKPKKFGTAPAPSGELVVNETNKKPSSEENDSSENEVERLKDQKGDQKIDAERCRIARKNIQQFEEFAKVQITDSQTGEKRFLDDAERASQLKIWKENADFYC